MTPDLTAVEQERVRLGEEAAGRSLEEYQREAAGSGSSGARGCCRFKKVRVDVTLTLTLKLEENGISGRVLGCAASLSVFVTIS